MRLTLGVGSRASWTAARVVSVTAASPAIMPSLMSGCQSGSANDMDAGRFGLVVYRKSDLHHR